MYCSSAAVRAGRLGSAVRWAVVGEEPMPASRLSAQATRQARLARTAPKISGLGRSSRFQGVVMGASLTGILAWSPMRAENRISIVLAKSVVKKRFDAVSFRTATVATRSSRDRVEPFLDNAFGEHYRYSVLSDIVSAAWRERMSIPTG